MFRLLYARRLRRRIARQQAADLIGAFGPRSLVEARTIAASRTLSRAEARQVQAVIGEIERQLTIANPPVTTPHSR